MSRFWTNGPQTDRLNLTNDRRIETYKNRSMTADKRYTSLSANTIKAKLTNHFITSSTDKHYSLDSEDDFRSGCRNVSHQQQFFSELPSPGRSHKTIYVLVLLGN